MMITTNGSKSNGSLTKELAPASPNHSAPGATVSGNGCSFEHDRIPRRRDDHGNRIAYGIAYIPPVSGSKDLEDTELRRLLAEIKSAEPVKAAYLGSLYQDRLRPAFLRLQSVRSEVETELAVLRRRSVELDREIDPAVESLASERETAIAPLTSRLEDSQFELEEAHKAAASQVAAVGGSYSPEEPSEDAVVRVQKISYEGAAHVLQLPWGSGADAFHLPTWLSWTITALCGSVMGVSLGIFGGFVEDLFGDPWMTLLWMTFGQGLAVAMRKAVGWAFFHFAESFYLKRPRSQQASWASAAAAVFASLLVVAMAVDKEGILKLAQFQALQSGLEHKELPALTMWCMAAVITLGYLVYAAYDGLVRGRQDAVENAITAEIERDYRERSEARRTMPGVREALEAINSAKEKMRRVAACEAALASKQGEFDQQISRHEAKRIAYPEELSLEQKQRVQDALDNLVGSQIEFDSVLAGVIGVSSRGSKPVQQSRSPKAKLGFWERVRRALRPR
jgi:hypothetical protein